MHMDPLSLSRGNVARLVCLDQYKILDTPAEPLYDRITFLAAQLLQVPVAVLVIIDANRLWFKSCHGIKAHEIAFDSTVYSRKKALIGSESKIDLEAAVRSELKLAFEQSFCASAVLQTQDGMMLGALCVLDAECHQAGLTDDIILRELATVTMALLETKFDRSKLMLTDSEKQAQQKRDTEQKINDSERRRLFVLEAARIGDWELDLITGVAQHSMLHDRCFGYVTPVEHWSYSKFLSHVHPYDRATVDCCFMTARNESGLYEVEFRVFWPDGSLHWLLSRGCFYHDKAGNPIRAAGIQVDISHSKMAQQHIDRLATAIESVTTAVITTDSLGRIDWTNKAFLDMTGFDREELIGSLPSILLQGPDSNSATIEIMRDAIRSNCGFEVDILNHRKDGTLFWQNIKANPLPTDPGDLSCYISVHNDITERKKLESQLWEKANYDGLTSLPNRRLFWDRLAQEIRHAHRLKKTVALLFIDLDRFKEINDLYGHEAGDLVLCEVARRISRCTRNSDIAARIGGDEFAAILTDFSTVDQIDMVIRKLLLVLSEPINCVTAVCSITASIGIAVYPDDASSPEQLLKYADQAMYLAKSGGRDRFSYFTPVMQKHAERRLKVGRDLRVALKENQLTLHFQPIIDLATGRIVKAEALLRWTHPTRGAIDPAEFIPLAEELGLIESIGEWVFHQATHCAAKWNQACRDPIQISINMSAMQFVKHNASESWPQYLHRLKIPCNHVSVEIPEGVLLKNSQMIIDTLADYRAAGMEIAIDDFGTGYSAMGYLKKFNVDYIKIDQSFIRDLDFANSRTIVEAIIVMGQKLGMKIIAEGVETLQERQFLQSVGCDFGQGFLFSKPVPHHEFSQFLQNNAGY